MPAKGGGCTLPFLCLEWGAESEASLPEVCSERRVHPHGKRAAKPGSVLIPLLQGLSVGQSVPL